MTMQSFTLVAITAVEKHLHSRLNIKSCNSQCSVKCRSRALGHGACLKSVSRTIAMQCVKLTFITVTEKHTLFLDSK